MIIERLEEENLWIAHGTIKSDQKEAVIPVRAEHPTRVGAFDRWIILARNALLTGVAK